MNEVKMNLQAQRPLNDKLCENVHNLQIALVKEDIRFELLQKTIINLDSSKVNSREYRSEQLELLETLKTSQERLDDTCNAQKSLQNWFEKYEPLKIQHQITDTLASCMNRKAKQKLGEYDLQVCDVLREKIMSDFGNPQIREKVLDMISKLERESKSMISNES